MNSWQAEQQMTTAIRFLISQRTQMIPKKILLTAFSHQESHVQKFKGMERRGSLVPVKKIELWLGEVKELRDKDGFVSLP